MPIQVSNFKVFDQVTNGKDFSLTTGTFSIGVNGNVQKVAKATYDLTISWESLASSIDEFVISGGNTLTRDAGNFLTDGMAIGDTIDILNSGALASDRVVTYVTDSYLTFDGATVADTTSQVMEVRGKNALVNFYLRFCFPSDTEEPTYLSRLTGRKLEWKLEGVTVGGSFEDAVWGDIKQGAKFGSVKIKHNDFASTYIQSISVEHEFIIEPIWLEGQDDNFTTLQEPDYLQGYSQLEYRFDLLAPTVIGNNQDRKGFEDLNSPSSIGWYNEVNKTGTANDYSITDALLLNNATASATNGLIRDNTTDVSFTVSNTADVFASGTHNLLVKVCKLPQEIEYADTSSDLTTTHILASERATLGGATIAGSDFIKTLAVVAGTDSDSQIDVSFSVQYSTEQKSLLNAGDKFLITCEIGEPNTAHLIAFFGEYVVDTDNPNLLNVGNFVAYDLATDPATTGYTELDLKVEDNVRFEFDLLLDLNENALLKSFQLGLFARNTITEEYFKLAAIDNDFEFVPKISDVQQINLDSTSGYLLKNEDAFNELSISTDTLTSGVQSYHVKVGLKSTWQDYIFNGNVDEDFYIAGNLNTNFNYLSSNYSGVNDYDIHFGIISNCNDGVADTEYRAYSPALPTKTYDDDTGGAVAFDATQFQTFTQLDVNVSPKFMTLEDTKVKVIFTPSTAVDDTQVIEGQINLYEFRNGTLNSTYQINSVNLPLLNQPLKPSDSETKLVVTNNGTSIDLFCQIDKEYINTEINFSYTISARIWNPLISASGKIMEDGTLKGTEGNIIKIID